MLVKALTHAAVFALCVTAAGAENSAPALQSPASVRAVAEAALRRELGDTINKSVKLEAANLDPRLRVPACTQAPAGTAAQPRGNQARVIVRVVCAEPSWTLNVPVEMRRHAQVLVLKRAIGRGESIPAEAVETQTRVLPGLSVPFLGDVADLQGRISRRPLAAGTAVTAESLTAAFVIHRGQHVTLAANMNGIEVRAPGTALADAVTHQRVRVQNSLSLKVVEGVAETAGVVRVIP